MWHRSGCRLASPALSSRTQLGRHAAASAKGAPTLARCRAGTAAFPSICLPRSLPAPITSRRFNDLQQRHAHVSRELEALEVSLVRASRAAAGAAPALGPPGAAPELSPAQQQMMELSKVRSFWYSMLVCGSCCFAI